eukprot:7331585-Prymnesium_polylepis.5
MPSAAAIATRGTRRWRSSTATAPPTARSEGSSSSSCNRGCSARLPRAFAANVRTWCETASETTLTSLCDRSASACPRRSASRSCAICSYTICCEGPSRTEWCTHTDTKADTLALLV